MFEVGDRVIMNPIHKNKEWYIDNTFIVLNYNESKSIIKITKDLKGGDYNINIFFGHLILDETYYRKEKLLKIKNKIKNYGI